MRPQRRYFPLKDNHQLLSVGFAEDFTPGRLRKSSARIVVILLTSIPKEGNFSGLFQ